MNMEEPKFTKPIWVEGSINNQTPKIDELVNSQKSSIFVIPANAGIQEIRLFMDPRFRGGDGLGDFLRNHQNWDDKNKDEV